MAPRRFFILAAIIVCIVASTAITGDNPSAGAIADRVTQLETQVRQLQDRIDRLEKLNAVNPPAQRPANGAVAGGWKSKANWDKIQRGMSEDQVIRILGQPARRTGPPTGFNLFFEGYCEEARAEISGYVFIVNWQVLDVSPPTW